MRLYMAKLRAWIAWASPRLWAWLVWASLSIADILIRVMLRTRSRERTIRPTERVDWPDGWKRALMKRQGNTCAYCGRRRLASSFEIDHMDPVVRGGSNDFDNLQVICRPCNQRKAIQTDQEFRRRYARLVPQRRLTPPSEPVSQSAFSAETRRTEQSSEVRHFRRTRFISPREKVFTGSLICGGVTAVAVLFGLAQLGAGGYFLLMPSVILGGGVSVSLWVRARVTDVMIAEEAAVPV